MWATAVIVFREILEASLIVSLVLAATQGMPKRSLYINGGIAAGVLGAVLIALLAEPIAAFADGMGQELFNASVLMLAVVMLTWHLVWMRKHSMQISSDINGMASQLAEGKKSMFAISIIVGLAILREGAEIILLLYGMTAAGADVTQQLTGGSIGLISGVVLGAALYFGLIKIPTRYFFKITGALILLLAAGLSAQAAAYLSQADMIPVFVTSVWDTSFILSEQSLPGQILHSLIGYTSQPSGIQVVFYLVTIVAIVLLSKIINRTPINIRSTSAAGIVMVAVIVSSVMLNSNTAQASDKIYSPYVEYGEFELEYRGHVTDDKRPEKDNSEKHKVEVVYGFTEYWSAGLLGVWEKKPGSSREFEATAWENVFQITDQGEYWVDVGLYLEYELAKESSASDKVEAKLLLEHPGIRFINTANIVLEREVGSNSSNATGLEIFWRTKYRWKQAFEPAIEIYSKFGEIGKSKGFDNQKHSIGPIIMGQVAAGKDSKLKYEFGYLVGVSDAAADGTWKWVIEWETRF
ncbi:MAG: FTR1 family protein [Gammaproteobacteria bacterium]